MRICKKHRNYSTRLKINTKLTLTIMIKARRQINKERLRTSGDDRVGVGIKCNLCKMSALILINKLLLFIVIKTRFNNDKCH